MNYEEMSDFEINQSVAAIVIGGDVIEKHDMAEAPTDNGVQVIYKVGVHGEFVDYCSNPSDAWPLLLSITDNECTIVIENNSFNGEPLNGKSITRKIAELYLSIKSN